MAKSQNNNKAGLLVFPYNEKTAKPEDNAKARLQSCFFAQSCLEIHHAVKASLHQTLDRGFIVQEARKCSSWQSPDQLWLSVAPCCIKFRMSYSMCVLLLGFSLLKTVV